MPIGLPSFYFPLREDDGGGYAFSQSFLITVDGKLHTLPRIVAFFALQIIGGHIGVPFILLTLYVAKGMKKHPMLVNFLVTWVIYSTSFCLLLYLGKQFGPEPGKGLCAVQASMIYGTSLMTSTAGLSFVLNLWLSLRAVATNQSNIDANLLRKYMLLAAPYGVFVIFVIVMASYGAANPTKLSRNQYLFYCAINSSVVDVVPCIAALILFTIIIFEGLIAVKLYRMHKAFVSMRTTGGPPLHLIVRVGIFSIYSFLAIVACIAFWSETAEELPYIIQASLPTGAFIVFGTQRDLLEVWGVIRLCHFLRRKPKAVQVVEVPKPFLLS